MAAKKARSEKSLIAFVVFVAAVNLALLPMLTLLSSAAQERFTRNSLTAVRKVLIVLYEEKKMPYPIDPADFMKLWKKRGGFPRVRIPGEHPVSNNIIVATSIKEVDDTGGWIYFNPADDPKLQGTLRVNCTHTDSRGKAWSEY